ncbi:50S ribosomal protein L13e [Dimargaris cristalligena]|uniref:50S ribosomal protein L13e n=1 Tax=Dimargaris cristalligena TaxID=215637 RepID=A0A4Q0A236_9FUNG|nr:50S ribosomal protein L13e [Dimargaris cristalligena]|eukprot:RKP40163.1 50S ribosomal protein L13e [Dimargaris cristalligena]
MKHNNQLPNVHFHKDWQNRVRTWFNQPGRKLRRQVTRAKKAAAIAPRPVDGLLRPAVRCPTVRYNHRMRAGRGFTLEELALAKVGKKYARTVGIAVDHRRRNRSEESLQRNVQRLQAYQSKLIVFPRKGKKSIVGDASAEEVAAVVQQPADAAAVTSLFAVQNPKAATEVRAVSEEEKAFKAYRTLRMARSDLRHKGIRDARRKYKADQESQKVKK